MKFDESRESFFTGTPDRVAEGQTSELNCEDPKVRRIRAHLNGDKHTDLVCYTPDGGQSIWLTHE